MSTIFCADHSLAVGEQLFGTAPNVTTWFLLEYNRRWEPKAFEGSDLSDAVKTQVDQYLNTIPNSRLQVLRQQPRLAPEGIAFYIGLSRETQPTLYEFYLEDYADLLALDIPAIMAEDAAYQRFRRADPLFLVCTHGRRDKCCAAHGLPSYSKLSEVAGAAVWQSSHVSGHRFAANVITFPHAIYNGRVRPDNILALTDAYRNGQIYPDTYRGRSCYPKMIQAADFYLRTESGITGIDAFRWLDTQPNGADRWRVRFVSTPDQTTHTVTVARAEDELAIYESCADDELTSVDQYYLVDHAMSSTPE